MSKVQFLKGLTFRLLTTAAGEVFEQFERTIAEYEEQLLLLKEENEKQKKLLDAVYSPQLRSQETDAQEPFKSQDFPPETQKKRNLNPDQEDPPKPLWSEEKQEELRGLKEDKSTEHQLKVVVMKSEDQDEDEKKLSFSQLRQKQTNQTKKGAEEEAESTLFTSSPKETQDFSVPDTDDSDALRFQSGLDEVMRFENRKTQTDQKPHRCTECGMIFGEKISLEVHMRSHLETEPFFCSMCDKVFEDETDLRAHLMKHGAEKLYSCTACYETFTWLNELRDHECVCRARAASLTQINDSPGSHQVFTDLDSFLSCVAEECVFCRTEQEASEQHLRKKHLRGAVYFLDQSTEKFAVACFCKDTLFAKRSHYHCPFCEFKPLVREFNFKSHMQKIHGISAGKVQGLKVYDVQRAKALQEEKLCEENEQEQELLFVDLEPQLLPQRPGSHQVFTDLDSFLSCVAEECVFCRTEQEASEKHLRKKHLREAIYFLDQSTVKFTVACFCKDTSDAKRSHYHCPFCEYKPLVREFSFKSHMQKMHGITAGKIKERRQSQKLREPLHFTPVPAKYDDDEEKPQSSQFYQGQTEETETGADGDDFTGPDLETEIISDDSSEPDTDDSDDWGGSGFKSKMGKKPLRCSECRKIFQTKKHLSQHMRMHYGEKPFSCSECGKGFLWKGNLKQHMESHKEGNPPAAPSAVKDVAQTVSEQTSGNSLGRETIWLP